MVKLSKFLKPGTESDDLGRQRTHTVHRFPVTPEPDLSQPKALTTTTGYFEEPGPKLGLVEWIEDSLRRRTSFDYDDAGREVVRELPDGTKVETTYYPDGWRLLASLMYEESRFDPGAVGPGGSAGLFQLMPFTWKELGVEDPHHPQEAAEAAGRYLRQLMGEFHDLPLRDQVAMAVASYNVGPGHIFDARKLAVEMGLDPNRWAGSVETAMLILDDPEVARGYSSGVCNCRRAVGYTRRILRRYGAYTEQFPPA